MSEPAGTIRQSVFASAARTATPTPGDYTMSGRRGMHLVIDVTALSDTPSVVPQVEAYDPLSGRWYALLTGAAITATGTTVLKVYPGIATQINAAASDIVPDRWRVTMTHADSDSVTYSAAAHLVP